MSGATAGKRLGYAGKEAKEKGEELLSNFFAGFPGVKKAIDDSKEFLKKNGYVEDFIGRRRRLDDINLEPYRAEYKDRSRDLPATFNPFLQCKDRLLLEDPITIWNQILLGYVILSNVWHIRKDPATKIDNEMSSTAFDNYKKIAGNPSFYLNKQADGKNYRRMTNKQKILNDMSSLSEVLKHRTYQGNEFAESQDLDLLIKKYVDKYGIAVPTDIPETPVVLSVWTGKIAQAERQCFNARIQGSAASLTKMAMVDIFNDEQLKAWNAHLIITVHDEVLVECPEEYADLVEKRLPEIMIAAAKRGGDDVPQSCDPYNVTRWYADTAGAFIQEEFKKLEKGDPKKGKAPMSREAALAKVIANHSEVPKEAIIKTIETGCDLDF